MRDLLVRGIAAAKAGEPAEARRYLEWALSLDPDFDQQMRAWEYLSQVCADPEEQRHYLSLILSAEPNDPVARRRLAILDGQLQAREVVDPDRTPAPAQPAGGMPVQARRSVCPTCGGKLIFTPDGSAQVCESCEQTYLLASPVFPLEPEFRPQDFTVAMATAQGHTLPAGPPEMECEACGATIALQPGALTAACLYCRSTYTLDQDEGGQRIRLEAMIPFRVDWPAALESLRLWLLKDRHTQPVQVTRRRGVYLPFWLFSFLAPEVNRRRRVTRRRYTQKLTPMIVSANRLLPAGADAILDSFELGSLAPFDPAYLAEWEAGAYQVSLADASLAARWQAVERLRLGYPGDWFQESGRPAVTSMDLMIERFWLVLLPLWVVAFRLDGKEQAALINGQNGVVLQVLPAEEMASLLQPDGR